MEPQEMPYKWVLSCALVVLIMSFPLLVSTAGQSGGTVLIRPTAELASNECNGLDIIALVDQSESMGGTDKLPPNDSENFRIDAAREVIIRLGENRLYFCPDVVHRVAILSFGDGPEVGDGTELDLPFTEITPDPKAEFAFWKERRQQLIERIQPKKLGHTDFATAFLKAKELFEQLPDLGNKKALILLTDGGPCVQELGCIFPAGDFVPGPYLTGLEEQIKRDFPFEEGQGYYIWVVAMHDRGSDYLNTFIGGDVDKTLGEYWEGIAESQGGSLIKLTKNREDIPATFFEILQNALGTGQVELLECGSHNIRPYVDKVIFIFFKGKLETGVSIEHALPDGTEVLIRDGTVSAPGIEIDEYLVDGHTERYIISKPDPGIWTLTADDCEGVRIYEELVEPQVKKIEPAAPVLLYEVSPFYDPNTPHYLTYQVEERGTGDPFPEDPRYPLTITAQITTPSGQQYERVLSSIGAGQYKSSTPILVGEVGDYPTYLVGKAENVGQVFSVDGGYYTVYVPIKLFDFQIVEPEENSVIPLNEPGTCKIRPVQVQLQLVDETGQSLQDERGQPLNPERISPGDLDGLFEITLAGTKGQPEVKAFMSPDPQQHGSFVADLKGADLEDTYTLQVSMKGEYREDRFRPQKTSTSLDIRRVASSFDFQVLEPQDDDVIPLNEPLTCKLVPIHVQLHLSPTLDVDPACIFLGDLDEVFEVTLAGTKGQPEVTAFMSPDPQKDGYFAADVEGADLEDTYTLQVAMMGEYREDRFRPQKASSSLDIRRVASSFDFQILEPQDDAVIPLNEPHTGKVAPVHVGLHLSPTLDVDPTCIFPGDLDKVFEVTLTGTKGQPEAKAFMSHQKDGSFVADLDGADLEDTYTLQVAMKGEYHENRFRPLKIAASLPIHRITVKYFDFQLIHPTPDMVLPIHGPLWDAFLGRVKTPEIRLQVTDETSKLPLDPNECFALPDQAFEVSLRAPDGSVERIQGTFVSEEGTQLWAGSFPAWQARAGDYSLEAKVNEQAVKERCVPLEKVRQVTFSRRDTPLTNPLVWRPAGGFISFLLALMAWIGRLRLRPAGFVSFMDRKTGMVLHEENLSNPLRGWFHRYVSKSRDLKDLDISKLVVTKGKPDEDGMRTANLIIYDQEGAVWVQEESLPSGEDFWLDAEVKVKYD